MKPAVRRLSLQARLLLAALAVLLVFVALTGLALDRAFRQSLETAQRERLQDRLYALLAILDVAANGQPRFVRPLPDPRYARPASGLYAQVEDAHGKVLLRTPSLLGLTLPAAPPSAPGEPRFIERRLDGLPHLALHYAVRWEGDGGRTTDLRIRLLEDRTPWLTRRDDFRRTLWGWLGGAAVLLLLVQAGVLRWGLRPLRQVSTDLRRIEQGRLDTLPGPYPPELQQLTDRIDALLQHNRRQVERYRDALGNLAHSLKTPLAILANAIDEPARRDPAEAREAVQRIREIIDYQLQRAATAARANPAPVPLRPQLERLLQTLGKVHGEARREVELQLPAELAIAMETGDLLELFGNLLDNAFKWAERRIRIRAAREGETIVIRVEDDGPGIPDPQKAAVRERGRRADTWVEGHGLGLAMVQEIVLLYGGELHIGDSPLGGAELTVKLPPHR